MRSEFEKWYRESRDITAEAGFNAAWQHRQTEVDELQNRVEKALNLVGEMEEKRYPFSAYVKELKALLSGEAHE